MAIRLLIVAALLVLGSSGWTVPPAPGAETMLAATALLGVSPASKLDATTDLPNVVVILTDDQGYADISLNPLHPKEVSTPHMDALAKDGIAFSQAYTSGSVCSPTRAGLMLGRYQQRVGVYSAGDGGRGFDPTLPIFPSFLPDQYVSTAIGKWHLGLDEDYPELNKRLIPQLEQLKAGSRIVAHDYGINGIRPDKTLTMMSKEDGVDHTIYLYTTPLKKAPDGRTE